MKTNLKILRKICSKNIFLLNKKNFNSGLVLLLFIFQILFGLNSLNGQTTKINQQIILVLNSGQTIGPCEFSYERNCGVAESGNYFYYYSKDPKVKMDSVAKIPLEKIREINQIVPGQEVPKGTTTANLKAEMILVDNSRSSIYLCFSDGFKVPCSQKHCQYKMHQISSIKIITDKDK
jgi:hypothetical protein